MTAVTFRCFPGLLDGLAAGRDTLYYYWFVSNDTSLQYEMMRLWLNRILFRCFFFVANIMGLLFHFFFNSCSFICNNVFFLMITLSLSKVFNNTFSILKTITKKIRYYIQENIKFKMSTCRINNIRQAHYQDESN